MNLRIATSFDPDAPADQAWTAWNALASDDGCGYGATEDDAVDDLLELVDPRRRETGRQIIDAIGCLCIPLIAAGICAWSALARAVVGL